MALSNGANLNLLANGDPGQQHYTQLMAQWRGFDALIQPRIVDKDLNAAPASPVDGACYIVGPVPGGFWANRSNQIARYSTIVNSWEFYTPKIGWSVFVIDENAEYRFTQSGWVSTAVVPKPQSIIVACSDEITALSAGTNKVTFRMPYAFTLTAVRASLTTAQSSGILLTVDINKDGVSILSTKITFDNTEKSSVMATVQPVISDFNLPDDCEISVDIDQIGGATAKGLKITLIGNPV
jgi:hypothetical protein